MIAEEIFQTTAAILSKMQGLNKSRKDFFVHTLILFLSIRGRLNFLQLGRHSDSYVESSFRLNFEVPFDFATFNLLFAQTYGSGHFAIGFDPSYIRKSGKHTPHTGRFWSGCSNKAEWGLEACMLSVIDVDNHTAFHFDAIASWNNKELKDNEHPISNIDFYAKVVIESAEKLEKLSNYLVADAFFAKKEFILPIIANTKLQVISRLRDDANLQYLYQGEATGKKGRPKKYDGKVNVKQPDWSKFSLSYTDPNIKIYDAIVFCTFLNRPIRIAYTIFTNKEDKQTTKIYFTTDLDLPAFMIVKYYQARFQQEFTFRDAKQFTGLQQCQARSTQKLEFHWNMALTATNIAKQVTWLSIEKEKRKSFSIANVKTLMHNHLLIQRFLSILPKNAQMNLNQQNIQQLYQFGTIAA